MSAFKNKLLKNHTAILPISFFELSCFPSSLPISHLLIIITKLCACDVMSTGLSLPLGSEAYSTSELEIGGEKVRNLNLYRSGLFNCVFYNYVLSLNFLQ